MGSLMGSHIPVVGRAQGQQFYSSTGFYLCPVGYITATQKSGISTPWPTTLNNSLQTSKKCFLSQFKNTLQPGESTWGQCRAGPVMGIAWGESSGKTEVHRGPHLYPRLVIPHLSSITTPECAHCTFLGIILDLWKFPTLNASSTGCLWMPMHCLTSLYESP